MTFPEVYPSKRASRANDRVGLASATQRKTQYRLEFRLGLTRPESQYGQDSRWREVLLSVAGIKGSSLASG